MKKTKNCPYLKNVLITGASSGIGRAAAYLFASKGFTVYALSRYCTEETKQYENGGSITTIHADVTDEVSLQRAVSRIDSLGIVIHCAGMGISGSAECTPIDAVKLQMDTNYFGVLRLNTLLLPMLRQNPKSLVMFTSSFAGLVPIPFQSHYSSSKYALEAYSQALGIEAKHYGVKVCIVEPGDLNTGFTKARMHNEPTDSPYYKKYKKAVGKMEKSELKGKGPEVVAKIFYKQVCKRNPSKKVIVGGTYKIYNILLKLIPIGLRDFILRLMY